MTEWFNNEEFWDKNRDILFGTARLESTPKEIDNLLSIVKWADHSIILDLCCGVGRHSVELASRGFRVCGVDRTASYIERAKDAATERGVKVDFVLSDMREYCYEDQFDGAINLFTSFGYFKDPKDDEKVATNIYRSLRPGGAVVLEMIGREILAARFRSHDWRELDDGAYLLERRTLSEDWGWIKSEWIWINNDQKYHHRCEHRLYTGTDLRHLLERVGFVEVKIYGSLSGEPYDHNAKRLVAVATKA